MSEKKLFMLPVLRCDELFNDRVRKAAEHMGVKLSQFMFAALVEKLGRMESEYRALHSIFGQDPLGSNESPAFPSITNEYLMFDEDDLG